MDAQTASSITDRSMISGSIVSSCALLLTASNSALTMVCPISAPENPSLGAPRAVRSNALSPQCDVSLDKLQVPASERESK